MPPATGTGALEQRVARVETSVELMVESVDKMARQVSRIAEGQAESGRTNWGVVFAGLALAASIMAPIITGMTFMIYRVDSQVVKTADKLFPYATASASQDERIKALERKVWRAE